MDMVSYNMGITTLPQSSVNVINVSHKGIKVLLLINQQVHWQVGVAWSKEGYISHARRTWIIFLKIT